MAAFADVRRIFRSASTGFPPINARDDILVLAQRQLGPPGLVLDL